MSDDLVDKHKNAKLNHIKQNNMMGATNRQTCGYI